MRLADDAARVLAMRLRALREQQWPGVSITQRQLAEAMSTRKSTSVPLISSWENAASPVTPSRDRLATYAAFFATKRSIERKPFRLIDEKDLTSDERARRDQLERELIQLRDAATSENGTDARPVFLAGTPWHFPDGMGVTIVCPPLPKELQSSGLMDPDDPDYNSLYGIADIDALFELYGHVRAVNPTAEVFCRKTHELEASDLTTHLVLLGQAGKVARDLLGRVRAPAMRRSLGARDGGYFEVEDGGKHQKFTATFRSEGERQILMEDIGQFYRGRNPYDRRRTVTICNGIHSRGVLGAVQALTDSRFRDRNADFIDDRFSNTDAYAILFRVTVVESVETVESFVLTPDLTEPNRVLYTWPQRA
jgi:transcriptional regulator with XRE-family HTH domain